MQRGVVLDDRFEIEEFAASGGMGSVFKGQDRLTGSTVAIKTFADNRLFFTSRFARESSILAELRHPRIVRFVARGLMPDGRPYLAMEWVSGATLADVLRSRRLSVPETIRVGRGVAEALGEVHRRGVFHRDLKPGNLVLCGPSLDVKVLDFGLVGLSGARPSRGPQGTPRYMSPEQVEQRPVDGRSDIFSLGCVLYECLTQTAAFQGREISVVHSKVVAGEPTPIRRMRSDCPDGLSLLIERMLSKAPDDRPGPDDVLAELRAIETGPIEASTFADGVTLDEQRITSFVVARDPEGPRSASRLHRSQLQRDGFGVRVMADGTIIAVFEVPSPPQQAALRGARAGLELNRLFSQGRATVALAEVRRGSWRPAGTALDAAFQRLASTPFGALSVEDAVAKLVSERFEIVGRGQVWVVEGSRPPGEEPRPVLGSYPPLLGRDTERRQLVASFRRSIDTERARAAVVLGEPGAGKTRLASSLVSEARRRGAAVLRVRGEGGWVDAFGPWLAGLAEAVGVCPELSAKERGERLRLSGISDDVWQTPEDPNAVLRAVAEWVEARDGGVVILFDDAHLADTAALQTAAQLVRRLADRPFWLLLTGSPALRAELRSSVDLSPDAIVQLGPLDDRVTSELVHATLGEACDAETLERVVERAQGNPYILEELICSVARGEGHALPQTVRGLVQARLDPLCPLARRVLRAGSVFGRRFTHAGLAELVDAKDDQLQDALEALIEAELVRRVDKEPNAFWILQSPIEETAYGSIPDDERVAAHARAAEWLSEGRRAAATEIARHWELGGHPQRAAGERRRAAQLALEVHDYDEALDQAGRGLLIVGPDRGELGRLMLVSARARYARGEFVEAAEASRAAAAGLEPASSFAQNAHAIRAAAAGHIGDHAAIEEVDTALRKGRMDTVEALDAAVECLVAFARVGALQRARAVEEDLIEPERCDEASTLAAAHRLRARAACAFFREDLSASVALGLEAAELYRASAAPRRACAQDAQIAHASIQLGDLPTAREVLRRSMGITRELGFQHVEASLVMLLGNIEGRQRNNDGAEALISRAIRSFTSLRDRRSEGIARAYLGSLLRMQGRKVEAALEADKSVVLLQPFPSLLPGALAVKARTLLDDGLTTEALQTSARAYARIADGAFVEEGEFYTRLVHALCLHANGAFDQAHEVADTGRQVLLRRSERIASARARSQYLLQVPEHARLLSLARTTTT